MHCFDVLKERGFFQQATHESELFSAQKSQSFCVYTGFDPTAESLHVGHLIPLMGLAHMQRAGQEVIVLMGGGTALIGDPSGKTEMRQMLTREALTQNIEHMKPQFSRFLELNEKTHLVNNADWLCNLNYLDFLRDIGRHFSVNRMLSFETYQSRLETGLSFLEFNYQLLQAYDFLILNERYGCTLQLGGNDQWANIVAGVDLVRRVRQRDVYGWTYPLLTTRSGKKMGKTEKGAVWLDSQRTSPYEYYQYWVNLEDADVGKCLSLFTFLPMDEIRRLQALEGAEIREAKAVLAFEATELAHGKNAAEEARQGAEAAFGGGTENLENLPTSSISQERLTVGIDLFSLYQEIQLCQSKSEARRLQQQGGIYVNGTRIDAIDHRITLTDLTDQGIVLRAGKKRYHRLIVSS